MYKFETAQNNDPITYTCNGVNDPLRFVKRFHQHGQL